MSAAGHLSKSARLPLDAIQEHGRKQVKAKKKKNGGQIKVLNRGDILDLVTSPNGNGDQAQTREVNFTWTGELAYQENDGIESPSPIAVGERTSGRHEAATGKVSSCQGPAEFFGLTAAGKSEVPNDLEDYAEETFEDDALIGVLHRSVLPVTKRLKQFPPVADMTLSWLKGLSVKEVVQLLNKLGFQHYTEQISKIGVTGEDLALCDEYDLTHQGFLFRPHRLRLLTFLDNIRHKEVKASGVNQEQRKKSKMSPKVPAPSAAVITRSNVTESVLLGSTTTASVLPPSSNSPPHPADSPLPPSRIELVHRRLGAAEKIVTRLELQEEQQHRRMVAAANTIRRWWKACVFLSLFSVYDVTKRVVLIRKNASRHFQKSAIEKARAILSASKSSMEKFRRRVRAEEETARLHAIEERNRATANDYTLLASELAQARENSQLRDIASVEQARLDKLSALISESMMNQALTEKLSFLERARLDKEREELERTQKIELTIKDIDYQIEVLRDEMESAEDRFRSKDNAHGIRDLAHERWMIGKRAEMKTLQSDYAANHQLLGIPTPTFQPLAKDAEKKNSVKVAQPRVGDESGACLLYTSPSPRDRQKSRMPSSA